MKYLLILLYSPLILSFDYQYSLRSWELKPDVVTARKLSIRSSLKMLKRNCDLQNSKDLFPLSCIKLLKAMKELNGQYNYKKIEKKILMDCADTINTVDTTNQLRKIEKTLIKNDICYDLFKSRKEIVEYKYDL